MADSAIDSPEAGDSDLAPDADGESACPVRTKGLESLLGIQYDVIGTEHNAAATSGGATYGVVQVETRWSNLSRNTYRDIVLRVLELGEGELLMNGDCNDTHPPTTLTVPGDHLGVEAELRPSESFDITLTIGLTRPYSREWDMTWSGSTLGHTVN